MKKFIEVLGIKINSCNKEEILEKIEKYIVKSKIQNPKSKKTEQKPLVIFTPNPEIIMFAQKYPKFREIVNSAQISIPDGVGVVWAANTLGYPIKNRIAGVDLVKNLVFLAEKQRVSLGIIGGFSKIALKSLECLRKDYPKLKGWAEEGPLIKLKVDKEEIFLDYGNWKVEDFIKRVKERDTKILLVGFGFPKQELFISEIASELNNIVIMAVGGALDYLSGRLRRAPIFFQKAGFEWLFRLIRQPYRLKRQLAIPKFIFTVLKQKFKLLDM